MPETKRDAETCVVRLITQRRRREPVPHLDGRMITNSPELQFNAVGGVRRVALTS
jgi:hypothetical protein